MRAPLPTEFLSNASRAWLLAAYPRLREWPRDEWPAALGRARATAFDMLERLAIVAAIGFTTYALQSVGADAHGTIARTFLQFIYAAPMLGLLVGPLLLRRTRRGLDLEAIARNGGERCPNTTQVPAHQPSRSGQGS